MSKKDKKIKRQEDKDLKKSSGGNFGTGGAGEQILPGHGTVTGGTGHGSTYQPPSNG